MVPLSFISHVKNVNPRVHILLHQEGEEGIERIHLLIHSLNGSNIQGWANLKLGDLEFHLGLPHASQRPEYLSHHLPCCLPRHLSKELHSSRINKGWWCHKWQINPLQHISILQLSLRWYYYMTCSYWLVIRTQRFTSQMILTVTGKNQMCNFLFHCVLHT